MQEDSATLTFDRGDASSTDLETAVTEVLNELKNPTSEASQLARAAKLDPSALSGAKVTVKEQPGIDPITTGIIVTIVGGVAAHAANTFWDDVIWPRIKKRLGARAAGKKRNK